MKAVKQTEVKMSRNQKVARQPKAWVSAPPMIGPIAGPRSGALQGEKIST